MLTAAVLFADTHANLYSHVHTFILTLTHTRTVLPHGVWSQHFFQITVNLVAHLKDEELKALGVNVDCIGEVVLLRKACSSANSELLEL